MPPKRKASATTTKPPKKLKIDTSDGPTPGSTLIKAKSAAPSRKPSTDLENESPQGEDADAEDSERGEAVWEVVAGGDREPLKVGVVAPDLLVLRFRNETTGKQTTHEYIKGRDEIDWKNEEDIKKIDKWRRQLFTRKGFANKVRKIPWAPEEAAYLELMYEKLRDALEADSNTNLPCETKIFEAFNTYFEGRDDLVDQKGNTLPKRQGREKSSLDSFVRRKSGSVNPIREEIKNKLTSKILDAWVPAITDAEIAAHISSKSAVGKASKMAASGTKKDMKNVKTPAPTKSKEKTTVKPATKAIAPSSKASSKLPESTGKDKIKTKSVAPNNTPSVSAPQEALEQSSMQPKVQPNGGSKSPDPSPASVTIQPRPKPAHTAPKVTTKEELSKLVKEGWSVPDFPKSSDEAIRRHREMQKTVSTDGSLLKTAWGALEDRLKRNPVKETVRAKWWSDLIDKEETHFAQSEESREIRKSPGRHEHATLVNAVLNYAIIPPFGYRGDIHDLLKGDNLSDFEALMAKTSRQALERVHREHDKAHDREKTSD
ncbi:hypothetical protein BDU57DRAFT_566157 [Ampelomyces quisqualis]|uniref:Uncharacterized protein n=1 Tax=Ampelomyces quisqualis TaxID=50730 RepID=A0A6A5Q9H7_AMPQU|nr:hypothetical protein BDU57DRAFT_566157 [Ampelomyces quisqualis]